VVVFRRDRAKLSVLGGFYMKAPFKRKGAFYMCCHGVCVLVFGLVVSSRCFTSSHSGHTAIKVQDLAYAQMGGTGRESVTG
jgi:hypothetical protein